LQYIQASFAIFRGELRLSAGTLIQRGVTTLVKKIPNTGIAGPDTCACEQD
jgi:hypothetical protein